MSFERRVWRQFKLPFKIHCEDEDQFRYVLGFFKRDGILWRGGEGISLTESYRSGIGMNRYGRIAKGDWGFNWGNRPEFDSIHEYEFEEFMDKIEAGMTEQKDIEIILF